MGQSSGNPMNASVGSGQAPPPPETARIPTIPYARPRGGPSLLVPSKVAQAARFRICRGCCAWMEPGRVTDAVLAMPSASREAMLM